MAQMPVIIAVGINFGIVPLLFVQVGFAKVFYPATILMAWFWLAVIVLLMPAYYGVYLYAYGLAEARAKPMPRWKRAAGWLAAVLFLADRLHLRQRHEPDGNVEPGPTSGSSTASTGPRWARP